MSEPVMERSVLERKERDELQTIARALGAEPPARMKKADLVDLVLRAAGITPDGGEAEAVGGADQGAAPTQRRAPAARARPAARGRGRATSPAGPAVDADAVTDAPTGGDDDASDATDMPTGADAAATDATASGANDVVDERADGASRGQDGDDQDDDDRDDDDQDDDRSGDVRSADDDDRSDADPEPSSAGSPGDGERDDEARPPTRRPDSAGPQGRPERAAAGRGTGGQVPSARPGPERGQADRSTDQAPSSDRSRTDRDRGDQERGQADRSTDQAPSSDRSRTDRDRGDQAGRSASAGQPDRDRNGGQTDRDRTSQAERDRASQSERDRASQSERDRARNLQADRDRNGGNQAVTQARGPGSQQQGGQAGPGNEQVLQANGQAGEDEGGNRRRRRRNRPDGPVDRPEGDEGFGGEPVECAGLLDLRDEGYGFLRVKGYLPHRDDVYVSVRQVRQLGLRKGDHLSGASRPANRQEKNPALLRIDQVNGQDPEAARRRPRFEDLTPLFPDSQLKLESAADPTNMTARIVDLISPIGKGQRGLIVSPPKAGKTTILKQIVKSIERNDPSVHLMVLLVDERPEEVTDMRRSTQGEVIASTFDRPADEHTAVSELVIERAKRLVEEGKDVVIVLDGITRLARAYNLAAPATGRIMSGGIDTGALYPPKKFFGAARNIEEGGSLTILATALIETGSKMDEVIFEEFKGTGNMELRLDRRLAERRIYPAIDVDASSTRHEELLFGRQQLQQVWRVRRALHALSSDAGSPAAALERLMDGMKTFRTNDEFLAEAAKS